ncbi:hypothetical protein FACS1894200_08320 [Spirochaetia bacterium]|nr:hypothetical protein FACS1894200_08320 [Spirochaetia bacterium]
MEQICSRCGGHFEVSGVSLGLWWAHGGCCNKCADEVSHNKAMEDAAWARQSATGSAALAQQTAAESAARKMQEAAQMQVDLAEKESFREWYKENRGKTILLTDVVKHSYTGKWGYKPEVEAEEAVERAAAAAAAKAAEEERIRLQNKENQKNYSGALAGLSTASQKSAAHRQRQILTA